MGGGLLSVRFAPAMLSRSDLIALLELLETSAALEAELNHFFPSLFEEASFLLSLAERVSLELNTRFPL